MQVARGRCCGLRLASQRHRDILFTRLLRKDGQETKNSDMSELVTTVCKWKAHKALYYSMQRCLLQHKEIRLDGLIAFPVTHTCIADLPPIHRRRWYLAHAWSICLSLSSLCLISHRCMLFPWLMNAIFRFLNTPMSLVQLSNDCTNACHEQSNLLSSTCFALPINHNAVNKYSKWKRIHRQLVSMPATRPYSIEVLGTTIAPKKRHWWAFEISHRDMPCVFLPWNLWWERSTNVRHCNMAKWKDKQSFQRVHPSLAIPTQEYQSHGILPRVWGYLSRKIIY